MDRDQRTEHPQQPTAFRISACVSRARLPQPYGRTVHDTLPFPIPPIAPPRISFPLNRDLLSQIRPAPPPACILRVTATERLFRVVRFLKAIYPQPRLNVAGGFSNDYRARKE